MEIKRPKGTNDFMPADTKVWHEMEKKIIDVAESFEFNEVRTPIFEHTELFLRSVGETSDIVDKEMYTFLDKGDRSITLRPEGTASVVRAFVENRAYSEPLPAKYYYMGPMFRYSRPQAGRYRQFHQFGVEVLGSNDPNVDGEVIELSMRIFESVGLKKLLLEINSVGCKECRPVHKEALISYLKDNYDDLCPTCQSRYEKNPLRIFDCKSEKCQEIIGEAPTITSCLCDECKEHFEGVKNYLNIVNVPYVVNEKMVRGLDYYTKTAFEIISSDLGAQSSIGGGGRYDGLTEEVGGPPTPGIGFAIGLERVKIAMEAVSDNKEEEKKRYVFIVTVSDAEVSLGISLVKDLRREGIKAGKDVMGRSLKAQFKYSNKIGATHVVTIGEDERINGYYTLKNMETGEEMKYSKEELIDYLKGVE